MAKPLVSILIPAYNAKAWITDTLRSAMAQTWNPKEIIVVDDGSTDKTLAIARQFESDQVRVVSQKNQGAAASRNTAYSLCRGDFIQYLDADDLMAPDKITRQLEALGSYQNTRTLLSGCWGRFMYRYYRTQFSPSALWCDLSPAEWLIRKMQLDLFMQTATWLVSRELAEEAGPWNTKLLGDDDGEYFCRVLLACDKVRFVPEARVFYRTAGPNSLSYIGRSDKKMEAQLLSMELHIRYVRSLQDNERVREACLTYLHNWMAFFSPDRVDLIRRAEGMAESLGSKLQPPELSWKTTWFSPFLGLERAKRVHLALSGIKWATIRQWDRALFRIEGRKFGRNPAGI